MFRIHHISDGQVPARVVPNRPEGHRRATKGRPPDPHQAERLVDECGLNGAKEMATPGVKLAYKDFEADESLPEKLHTAFRGAAARGNYLSADRIDCQYACK